MANKLFMFVVLRGIKDYFLKYCIWMIIVNYMYLWSFFSVVASSHNLSSSPLYQNVCSTKFIGPVLTRFFSLVDSNVHSWCHSGNNGLADVEMVTPAKHSYPFVMIRCGDLPSDTEKQNETKKKYFPQWSVWVWLWQPPPAQPFPTPPHPSPHYPNPIRAPYSVPRHTSLPLRCVRGPSHRHMTPLSSSLFLEEVKRPQWTWTELIWPRNEWMNEWLEKEG